MSYQGRSPASVDGAGAEREWVQAQWISGDAFETLPQIEDVFDVVLIDAGKEDYEELLLLSGDKVEVGALVVADNVLSHEETLGAYSEARKADPATESVTLPLDRGLELSVILTDVQ